MQLDFLHLVLIVLALGFGVPWLQRRGALPTFGKPVAPATPDAPPIVQGAPSELNVLLQAILDKLVGGLPLLSWETSLLKVFAGFLLSRMPGLEAVIGKHTGSPVPATVPTPPAA